MYEYGPSVRALQSNSQELSSLARPPFRLVGLYSSPGSNCISTNTCDSRHWTAVKDGGQKRRNNEGVGWYPDSATVACHMCVMRFGVTTGGRGGTKEVPPQRLFLEKPVTVIERDSPRVLSNRAPFWTAANLWTLEKKWNEPHCEFYMCTFLRNLKYFEKAQSRYPFKYLIEHGISHVKSIEFGRSTSFPPFFTIYTQRVMNTYYKKKPL